MGTSFPALAELSHYPMASGQLLRYGLAGTTMFAIARRRALMPARELPRVAAMAATGLVGTNLTIIAAERSTDPATVGIVVGCLPVAVALAAPLTAGRRVDRRVFVCAALAVLGTVLVQSAGARATAGGIGYAVGALTCELLFIILGASTYERRGALTVSPWLCVMAVCILLVVDLVAHGSALVPLPTARQALAIGYLGCAASVVAMLGWGFGLARLGPEVFGLFTGAIPIAALLASVALGLSTFTVWRLLGCLIVSGAVIAGMRSPPPPIAT